MVAIGDFTAVALFGWSWTVRISIRWAHGKLKSESRLLDLDGPVSCMIPAHPSQQILSDVAGGPEPVRRVASRVHNPGREVRFPGKFPVPGTVRDAFPGPGFWLPGFQIQKSKSQIFWSKTNPGITVAVM